MSEGVMEQAKELGLTDKDIKNVEVVVDDLLPFDGKLEWSEIEMAMTEELSRFLELEKDNIDFCFMEDF